MLPSTARRVKPSRKCVEVTLSNPRAVAGSVGVPVTGWELWDGMSVLLLAFRGHRPVQQRRARDVSSVQVRQVLYRCLRVRRGQ